MFRPLLALCMVVLLGATPAHALVQRAYVSALTGNDANTATDCQATAPCRWFAGAISVVASGGEIVAMDTGAYGTVTITKSIAIVAAPGAFAGITVFSGDGVGITTAGVDVLLRGLTINRLGGTGNGIFMTAGNSLTVQNCVITNFDSFISGYGLYVSGSVKVRVLDSLLQGNLWGASFSNGPTALISGTRFLDNNGPGLYAYASGAGVVTRVDVSRSEASGNGGGFEAHAFSSGRVELDVKDSVASKNDFGVLVDSSSGTAMATVSDNLISGNTSYGLFAEGSGAKLVATGNKVSHNGTGLRQGSSAVLQSTGDNTVTDNTTATSGTITGLANM